MLLVIPTFLKILFHAKILLPITSVILFLHLIWEEMEVREKVQAKNKKNEFICNIHRSVRYPS